MTSATVHPASVVLPGEGHQLNELGHTAIEKIGSAETGDAYYSFEVLSPPGLGIPPHVHGREDAVIYVVESA